MWRTLFGWCLAGCLVVSLAGCVENGGRDGDPTTVDPTSDFETQTRHDEAYDQQPYSISPDNQ